jgi:glycosyltransferase involved in cell wall biosynthesis
MNPLVSIIVPVYKSENYLERCLKSLIDQTYKNIEIILIYNQKSSDKCPEICNNFAISHKNIQLIHQEDCGPSAARNVGIDLAKGSYLVFVDSDDFVDISMVDFLRSELESNGVLLSMCGYENYPIGLTKKDNKKIAVTSSKINDAKAFELLLDNQALCAPWAKMYDASLFKNLRFPITRNEDMFLTPQIFKKARQISISSKKLYYYSQEGPSLVRSPHTHTSVSQYFEANQYWKNFASTNYPEISEKADSHFYRNILDVCREIRKDNQDSIQNLYKKLKSLTLKKVTFLLASKHFSIKDKVKLVLLKINFY